MGSSQVTVSVREGDGSALDHLPTPVRFHFDSHDSEGLSNYFLCHDRERKKEAHYGGKIMRESALYMFGRTGEGILFV